MVKSYFSEMFNQKSYLICFLCLLMINLGFAKQTIAQQDVKKKIWKVVIDPGHGGIDPGALGEKCYEKTLSLSISLGKYLEEKFDDVEVIYTRDKDMFLAVHRRAEIANEHKADLFISIHLNSFSKSAIGTITFVMGLNKSGGNLEAAKIENSVILLEEDYSTKYDGYDPNSPESLTR